jgi:hypothetical protein
MYISPDLMFHLQGIDDPMMLGLSLNLCLVNTIVLSPPNRKSDNEFKSK